MILKNFEIENNEGNTKEIDEKLNARLSGQKDRRIYRKVWWNDTVNMQENV